MAVALPRIGLTARRTGVDQPYPLVESVALQATYSDAVVRAGGLPLLLAPRELGRDEAERIIATLDGLVLTGGDDVDPELYGQSRHPSVRRVDPLQDRFEVELLAAALDAELPIMCICRGMQVLNVMRGGTLDQHIVGKEGIDDHGIPFGGGGTRHTVAVTPGTRLAEALGTTSPTAECHHHQAVEVVGEGLVVVARAADGTVEGLDVPGRSAWIIAMQWHPEDTAGIDPTQQRVFDELVRQSRG